MLKQAIGIVVCGLILGLLNAFLNPLVPAWQRDLEAEGKLTLEAALQLAKEGTVLWVDARSAEEYAAEHIPGAVLLNEDSWNTLTDGFFAVWEEEQTIIVYCSSGGCQASEKVASRIQEEFGLEPVWVLSDGWEAWKEAQ